MDNRDRIVNMQEITPERIDALTARAHRLRNEYIAQGVRRMLVAVRRGLGRLRPAPMGRLGGSH